VRPPSSPAPPPGATLVRLAARILPAAHRDEWLAEWLAELEWSWRGDPEARLSPSPSFRNAFRLRLRCVGAIADAALLRRRLRRGEDARPHSIANDVRFAVRSLRRTPVFTAVVVSTLALCIGATTSVFSIVESALLNGLGYRQIDRLVAVWSDNPQENNDHYQASVGDYFDWRARNHSFTRLAGYFPIWNALYAGAGGVERIDVGAVSANFLRTLGAAPGIGRDFADGEDQPGAAGTVILSHEFWSRALQGDPRVVGQTLTFDGKPYAVIGVMDSHFVFPQSKVDVLLPLSVLGTYLDRREVHMLSVVGRLRDGVSLDAARREMAPIAAQLRQEHAKEDGGLGITVRPLRDDLVGDVRRPILILFGAVCAVLLIGCANVTNLMFGRAWGRRQELAVRTAMGAQPKAIVQQLLVESAVVAVASAAMGAGLAFIATRALSNLLPLSITRLGPVAVDGPVLAFTLGVSVVVTLVCGTAPAFGAARTTMRRTLADSARLSHGRGSRRMYRALVVGELVLALVLTVGAGLLINSFARLSGVDPGFRRDRVVRMKIALPQGTYASAGARFRYYQSLLDQIRALPGVRDAGTINRFPLHDGTLTTAVVVEGDPPPAPGLAPSADYRVVSVGYFRAMGIPLLAGRDFAATDKADSTAQLVAIVNETATKTILHAANPVGKRVGLGGNNQPLLTIVGVVRDVRGASLREPPRAQIFVSAQQAPQGGANLVVHYDGAAASVVSEVRRIVRSIDNAVPLFDVQTIGEVLDKASVGDRFTMTVLAGFSFLALLLAALGTYSVMAYGVSERTREIGVRIALGARAEDVLAMILREGALLFAIALPLALGGVWTSTRAMQSLLFGVEPNDPRTVLLAVLTLGTATAVACYLPARKAARVDPTTAIRG
jgi:predicted permease